MTANKLTSCILLLLIFCRRIQVRAQFEPPYVMPAHAQFGSVFGWVLKRHVIKTFSKVVGVGRCIKECSRDDYCYSLNFYPDVGVCELNSATHTSHPGHYVQSRNGSFLLYVFRPATICDDSFCTPGTKCFLGKDGITRQCKGESVR